MKGSRGKDLMSTVIWKGQGLGERGGERGMGCKRMETEMIGLRKGGSGDWGVLGGGGELSRKENLRWSPWAEIRRSL